MHRAVMSAKSVHGETRIRAGNQLTLPEAVAKAAGVSAGVRRGRFIVTFEPDHPGVVRLDRVRDSYAGALKDAYGDPEAYLDEMREGWR